MLPSYYYREAGQNHHSQMPIESIKDKNYCLHTALLHLGNISAFLKTRNGL